jgi:hypothetical protein
MSAFFIVDTNNILLSNLRIDERMAESISGPNPFIRVQAEQTLCQIHRCVNYVSFVPYPAAQAKCFTSGVAK